MAKDGSVAPKERVNIVYQSQTGGGQEEVELPLKVLMMGDYTGRQVEEPVAERKAINVDKQNFNGVMASQKIGVNINVSDKVASQPGSEMAVNLSFQSMRDFEPEAIAAQVPELKKLLELRNALSSLRGPLQNKAAFRRKMQDLLSNEEARTKLMGELGLGDGEKK